MNLKNILNLIQDKQVKNAVMKILEFEQSQLHKTMPQYKDRYKAIIEEALRENPQD